VRATSVADPGVFGEAGVVISGGRIDAIRPPGPYNLKSFCRHLDAAKVSWRWYSHDYVPTIWLLDPEVGLSLENVPVRLAP
jgi:hypothetical protein